MPSDSISMRSLNSGNVKDNAVRRVFPLLCTKNGNSIPFLLLLGAEYHIARGNTIEASLLTRVLLRICSSSNSSSSSSTQVCTSYKSILDKTRCTSYDETKF